MLKATIIMAHIQLNETIHALDIKLVVGFASARNIQFKEIVILKHIVADFKLLNCCN